MKMTVDGTMPGETMGVFTLWEPKISPLENNFDKFLIMLVLLCILNVYVLVCVYIKGHVYLLNKEFETLNVLLTTETF